MAGIAHDVDPAIKVAHYPERRSSGADWKLTLPDGSNAYVKETKNGEIILNASELTAGQSRGSAVYHIIANFAHNTGKVFIGDPAGLSNIALRRRTENMLSSALKFKTAKHLWPHERQIEGDKALGVEPLKWGDNDAANIASLIEVAHKNTLNILPETADLRYNFKDKNFEVNRPDGTVKRLGENDFKADADQSRGERAAQAGPATLKRTAIINTLAQGAGREGWRGILGEIARQLHTELDPALRRNFYSRLPTEPAAGGFSASGNLAVVEARVADFKAKNKGAVALDFRVVRDASEVPAGYGASSRTEGFFYPTKGEKHGEIYLVADNLRSASMASA